MSDSSVQFAGQKRVHISLAVADLQRSVDFYQKLFEVAPTKTRAGYARFEASEPALNLSIIESSSAMGPADPVSHFGIQVKSIVEINETRRRLESDGLLTRPEESVNCCHAVQDKIWIVDPDGYRWEVFVVLDDHPAEGRDDSTDCCPTITDEACCRIDGEPCCPGTE